MVPQNLNRLWQISGGRTVLVLLISELLHVYTPSRMLRSSSDTGMLKIEQYKHKTHGFRHFVLLLTQHLEFTPTSVETLLNPVVF